MASARFRSSPQPRPADLLPTHHPPSPQLSPQPGQHQQHFQHQHHQPPTARAAAAATAGAGAAAAAAAAAARMAAGPAPPPHGASPRKPSSSPPPDPTPTVVHGLGGRAYPTPRLVNGYVPSAANGASVARPQPRQGYPFAGGGGGGGGGHATGPAAAAGSHHASSYLAPPSPELGPMGPLLYPPARPASPSLAIGMPTAHPYHQHHQNYPHVHPGGLAAAAPASIASAATLADHSQPLSEQFHFSTQLRRASSAYERPSFSTPRPQQPPGVPAGVSPSAYHCHRTVEQVQRDVGPDSLPHGLASHQVESARSLAGGYNEFSVADAEPAWRKFAQQFQEPLIALLLGSAGVSALTGEWDDAVSIAVAVVVVITVGFVQERRSEKSLEALNRLVPHYCHLIRDGATSTVLANELVPGDVVSFSTGDRVPADVRLFEAVQLEVDESTLTGETKPLRKTAGVVPEPKDEERLAHGGGVEVPPPNFSTAAAAAAADEGGGEARAKTSLGERENIGFMGTLVKNGYGKGIVIATGSRTEFGLIFSMVDEVGERRTPLQLSMDELAKKLSFISFGIIGVICVMGVLQHKSWLEMFTIGVSLAVAAIPEGLPIVVTVTLALGVLRMSRRKAIVKRLPSVETLGCVSVICSDKTGTLTTNQLSVVAVFTLEDGVLDLSEAVSGSGSTAALPLPHAQSPALARCLLVGNLCNNARRDEGGRNVGQPTDVALLDALRLFGMDDRRPYFRRTAEVAFSSELKYMSVTGCFAEEGASTEHAYVKGAVEVLLERCTSYVGAEGRREPLDAPARRRVQTAADELARRGYRVLLAATGAAGSLDSGSLAFCGLQAMHDPPRPGVREAVAALERAKVQVVMITGDSELTACAIARQLGILKTPAAPAPPPPWSTTSPKAIVPPDTPASAAWGSPVAFSAFPDGGATGASSPSWSTSSVARASGGGLAVMTGRQLDQLTPSQLRERIGSVCVFARTTPRHKMAIVGALQANGAVVGMSGDGVNDAPALKMADIGISMGKGGTDVAKEAADVILVDDNFATILPAVEEGKGIFYNIQNFLAFQLSTAVAALTLISLSTALGLKPPLNPMQILFINIIMDGPPSQSLGVDPVEPSVMRRPPRARSAPIVTPRLVRRCLFSATLIVLGTLWVYVHELNEDGFADQRDQTMTFACFVLLDLVSAVQNRGLSTPLLANRMLVATVAGSAAVLASLLTFPLLQGVFQTVSLGGSDAAELALLAAASFGLHEARRGYERRWEAAQGERAWEESVV